MYIGLLQRSAKLPDCPHDRPWFVGLEARRHPRRHHLLGAFRRDLRSLRSLRLHHSLPGGDFLGTGNKVVVGCGHGYRCFRQEAHQIRRTPTQGLEVRASSTTDVRALPRACLPMWPKGWPCVEAAGATSALGHLRTLERGSGMSALSPEADKHYRHQYLLSATNGRGGGESGASHFQIERSFMIAS